MADHSSPSPRVPRVRRVTDALRERVTGTVATEPWSLPTEGALALLANDPLTQGPRLFASQCASCHTYSGHDGLGAPLPEPPTAPTVRPSTVIAWE